MVVDSEIVNAFAIPGGFIVVYSGILDIMEDERELAALLAHEASHINERHSLRMMSRNLSTYLLLSILTGDVGGFSSVIVDNSNMFSTLSFSRGLEQEADLEGLDLMVKSDIDPQGMVELFKKFASHEEEVKAELTEQLSSDSLSAKADEEASNDSESSSWRQAIELLSTHPNPENRMEYLTDEIKKLKEVNYPDKFTLSELFKQLRSE